MFSRVLGGAYNYVTEAAESAAFAILSPIADSVLNSAYGYEESETESSEDNTPAVNAAALEASIADSVSVLEAFSQKLAAEDQATKEAQVELEGAVDSAFLALGVVRGKFANVPAIEKAVTHLGNFKVNELPDDLLVDDSAPKGNLYVGSNLDLDGLDAILTDDVVAQAQAKTIADQEDVPHLGNFKVKALPDNLDDLSSDDGVYPLDDNHAQGKVIEVSSEEGDSSEEESSDEFVVAPKKQVQAEDTSSDEFFAKKKPAQAESEDSSLEEFVIPRNKNNPKPQATEEDKPGFFATHPKVKWALIGLAIGLAITAFVAISVFTFGGAAVTAAALAIILGGGLLATGVLSAGLGLTVPGMLEDKANYKRAKALEASVAPTIGPVAQPQVEATKETTKVSKKGFFSRKRKHAELAQPLPELTI